MTKVIAWLVLIFIVLLALRLINARKSRTRQHRAPEAAAAPMVRCERCGVFLPRTDALAVGKGYTCADGQCTKH